MKRNQGKKVLRVLGVAPGDLLSLPEPSILGKSRTSCVRISMTLPASVQARLARAQMPPRLSWPFKNGAGNRATISQHWGEREGIRLSGAIRDLEAQTGVGGIRGETGRVNLG